MNAVNPHIKQIAVEAARPVWPELEASLSEHDVELISNAVADAALRGYNEGVFAGVDQARAGVAATNAALQRMTEEQRSEFGLTAFIVFETPIMEASDD